MQSRKNIGAARRLRRDMADAERTIWQRIRAGQLNGHKFRRQHPIGPYIADFVCIEARLIVEVDGGQHAENAAHDEQRSQHLRDQGFTVIRFWNNDVLIQTDSLLTAILQAFDAARPPSPHLAWWKPRSISRQRARG